MKLNNLFRNTIALSGAFLITASASAQFVINEVDSDTPVPALPRVNDDVEFVEIYGAPNASLSGYVLVFYNGSNNLSYFALDLDAFSTDANGFLLLGNTLVTGRAQDWAPNTLQNGQDAVALFQANAADFPNNTAVTTTNLIDAVVYDTSDLDDPELVLLMDGSQPQIDENANSVSLNDSIQRVPDGGTARNSTTYVTKAPTPGATNQPAETLTVTFAPASISEADGASASTATVTRTGSTAVGLVVTLTNGDNSEISIPATVTIPALSASATFAVDAVNDLWADGTQTVTITLAAANFIDGSNTIEVTDDADPIGLIVNEVHPTGQGDANGDFSTTNLGLDEFVEIVNGSAVAYDLSGFTLSDSTTLRHTFPAGTVIKPGCALVLFGGGNIVEGTTAAFGGAWIQKANTNNEFGLGLDNQGDRIRILNVALQEVGGFSYPSVGLDTTALTRSPDLTGAHVLYSTLFGSFSPGVQVDRTTPFCPIPSGSLTLSLAPTTVVENAGAGATTLTVTRPLPYTGDLVVQVISSDITEAVPASPTVTIPDGQPSATIAINAVNDPLVDGTISVAMRASAVGLLNGEATLSVDDDGDLPPALYINEVDADSPGSDVAEFVELYAGSPGVKNLDGFIVVFFNGNDADRSYLTVDLTGKSTDADGFFVIGNAGVPEVGHVLTASSIQNGTDAIAIYQASAASFPNSTPPTTVGLVDAVVYGNGSAADAGLSGALTPSNADALDNATQSFGRQPDATSAYIGSAATMNLMTPTPGATNGAAPVCQFPTWANDNGIPGGLPDEDADKDGIKNVLEYALGFDPLLPNTLPSLVPSGGDFTITYPKGAGAGIDAGLTYSIQISPDLDDWSTLSPTTNNASSISATLPGGLGLRFARLKVVCTP